MHRFAAGKPGSIERRISIISKQKTYRIFYEKEEKEGAERITVSSYARDIANEVFIRLSDSEFMAKVQERIGLEEKAKVDKTSETKTAYKSKKESDGYKEIMKTMPIGNTTNPTSMGAT